MDAVKKLLIAMAFSCCSTMMPAQSLPQLDTDSRIVRGELRCGVKYYLIQNTVEKGYADIAVIRKGDALDRGPRKMLDSLYNFSDIKPYRFLSRHGIGYRKDGYFSISGPVTAFHFDNVPTYNSSAADSTLLLSFNLIGESLTDQAIIVSGDISTPDVIRKMDIFSLSLLPRFKPNTRPERQWSRVDTASIRFRPGPASITATYRSERTPKALMNTAQPLVMQNFSEELDVILTRRIIRALQSRGIPTTGCSYTYTGSAATSGDERHTITVGTDAAHLHDAATAISETISTIAGGHISIDEYTSAKAALYVKRNTLEQSTSSSNADFISRCTASFLYSADLAPVNTRISLTHRNIDNATELRLFNGIASAIFDREANLTLTATGTTDTTLLTTFNRAWDRQPLLFPTGAKDTLGLQSTSAKTRIRKVSIDPISGGELWTFSNGIQVIFKRTAKPSNQFHFGLFIKGGYSGVATLRPGEGGFFSDILSLYDIAGLKAPDFANMLSSNGITLTPDVSPSGLSLTGNAPSNRLPLVLKSLLSIANNRTLSPDASASYIQDERLRIARRDSIGGTLDRMMYPGYVYTPFKDPSRLNNALISKADKYFNERFINVNDGILVICGDLQADALKKMLARFVGGFRTGGEETFRRTSTIQPRSGESTFSAEGRDKSINILIAAPMAYTTTSYITTRIALPAIRRAIVDAVAPYGMAVEVTGQMTVFPQENFSVRITCTPAASSGLPASIPEADQLHAISAVRRAISQLGKYNITDEDAKAWSAMVSAQMTAETNDAASTVNTVITRYSSGKDLVTRYSDIAGKTSADDIREILASVSSSGRVEYVIR